MNVWDGLGVFPSLLLLGLDGWVKSDLRAFLTKLKVPEKDPEESLRMLILSEASNYGSL